MWEKEVFEPPWSTPSIAASVIDIDLTESATVPDDEPAIEDGKKKRKRKVMGIRRSTSLRTSSIFLTPPDRRTKEQSFLVRSASKEFVAKLTAIQCEHSHCNNRTFKGYNLPVMAYCGHYICARHRESHTADNPYSCPNGEPTPTASQVNLFVEDEVLNDFYKAISQKGFKCFECNEVHHRNNTILCSKYAGDNNKSTEFLCVWCFNKDEYANIEFESNSGSALQPEQFNLLGCPDEVIDEFFSYLDPEERMKMRLNKRTKKIVDESKYYLEEVDLKQNTICVTIENRKYPIDLINRIAHNTSIGKLRIEIPASGELLNKFLQIMREFSNVDILILIFWTDGVTQEKVNEIMIDSFFLNLTRRCNSLSLRCNYDLMFNTISVEALHQVYKSMNDGSTSVNALSFCELKREIVDEFLNLLGITFINNEIISKRSIEAYKDYVFPFPKGRFHINIFCGFFQVRFRYSKDKSSSEFEIELHKNMDALNRAKKYTRSHRLARARMNVYSE